MAKIYLWLNAALYLALVLWCTFKHTKTSRASGFLRLDNSGNSEYLVIYGGMQLGLAIFFGYLGATPALYHIGLVFSLLLYAPIVVYRIVTVVKFSPVSAVALGTGALELVLLVSATALVYREP